MLSGFDFGTSNCAIGVVDQSNDKQQVKLLPIDNGQTFMPSALYSLHRDLICESAALLMADKATQASFMQQRTSQLEQARRVRINEQINANVNTVFVGQEAFDEYLSFPDEGYFVKSVKSFLGSTGLQPNAIQFFEDIVTAMMLTIKQRAEHSLGKTITHTVIGRPVNFQGIYPEQSNRLAIEILTVAAKRAGFQTIEFLFEPIAAGLDFEQGLESNKTVLIVDVGGGTTDCSMIRMGPDYRDKTDRSDDILANSGDRVGGNDFDIHLAGNIFMPLLGLNSNFKDGRVIPNQIFWSAVKTNHIGEQAIFNGKDAGYNLRQYLSECAKPELLSRFIKLRDEKKNHQLVRVAEQTKIALSDTEHKLTELSFIEEALSCPVTREQFSNAVNRPVKNMVKLIDEVITQSGCQPELVYITGGAAKAHIIREAIETKLAGIDIIDGDHFGSVAKGLTVWAQRLFA